MKGIPFKPDMIKAIAEGRKTQTRRVIKNKKPLRFIVGKLQVWNQETLEGGSWWDLMPKYQVGEVVYIKEAWHFLNANYESPLSAEHFGGGNDFAIEYTDGELRWWKDNGGEYNYPLDEKKRSPMFLPEKYARYFIKIKDVRPERLQEITPSDCRAEGSYMATDKDDEGGFVNLWDSINPKHPFELNNWVWRYEFEKIEKACLTLS